jgi:hypothetical protein
MNMNKKIVFVISACLSLAAFGSTAPTRGALAPEVADLLIDLDSNTHAALARNHKTIFSIDLDWLMRGRVTLNVEKRLNPYLMIVLPMAFETSKMSMVHEWATNQDPSQPTSTALSAGLGLKIRLSEWASKGSFFLEPQVNAAYFWLNYTAMQPLMGWRLRPAVLVGWEKVFDSGLVVRAKIGLERPFDFPAYRDPPNAVTLSMGMGYAF